MFVYSVKFICGEQKDGCCGCNPVQPGRYSTEINIHNPENKTAAVLKRAIPLVLAGAVSGREPKFKQTVTKELIRLPAHSATMDDCCHLLEILLGGGAGIRNTTDRGYSGNYQQRRAKCNRGLHRDRRKWRSSRN